MSPVLIANIFIHIVTLIAIAIFLSSIKRGAVQSPKNSLILIGRYAFLFYLLRLLNFIFDTRLIDFCLVAMAAFIPLMILRMLEQIESQHAPFWLKLSAAFGGLFFTLMELFGAKIEPQSPLLLGLFIFQFVFIISVIIVTFQDMKSPENADKKEYLRNFAVASSLVLPLLITDYGLVAFMGELKLSNIALMVFIWLAYDRKGRRSHFWRKIISVVAIIFTSSIFAYVLQAVYRGDGRSVFDATMMLSAFTLLVCIIYAEVNYKTRSRSVLNLGALEDWDELDIVAKSDMPNFKLGEEILQAQPFVGLADLDEWSQKSPLATDYLRQMLKSRGAVLVGQFLERPDEIVFVKQSSLLESAPGLEDYIWLLHFAIRKKEGGKMIEIERGQFDDFFEVPFAIYPPNSKFVSVLKSDLKRFLSKDQNPLFADGGDIEIFTAKKNGQLKGRITAHFHAGSNEKFAENVGYFGYFDCVDDEEVAGALLRAAEDWALRRGFEEIRGNFNLTAMQQIGVMTDGFDCPSYTDLLYSPPQIARLLKSHGYVAYFPMTTFELDVQSAIPPAMTEKQQKILADQEFQFVPITRRNVKDRMEDARQILNASFAKNPMFVPVSSNEFNFQAKDMKWIIDPQISKMLYYKGKPAAVIICIPDLNPFLKKVKSRASLLMPYYFLKHKFQNKNAVLIFSGVIPELQGKGVNPLVLREVVLALKDAGYEKLGNTWIADVNKASLAQKAKSGADPLQRLHLFKKALR